MSRSKTYNPELFDRLEIWALRRPVFKWYFVLYFCSLCKQCNHFNTLPRTLAHDSSHLSNSQFKFQMVGAIAVAPTLENLAHKMSGFRMSGFRIPTVVWYSLSGSYAFYVLWPDFQMTTKTPKPNLLKSVFESSGFWASGIRTVPVSTFFFKFVFWA